MKGLKDDDLVALAKHFTALEPKPSEEKIDPALVKRGEALVEPMRCESCHLPSLAGQQQMPRLAKQRIDYLIHSLKQFRDNEPLRRRHADEQRRDRRLRRRHRRARALRGLALKFMTHSRR